MMRRMCLETKTKLDALGRHRILNCTLSYNHGGACKFKRRRRRIAPVQGGYAV